MSEPSKNERDFFKIASFSTALGFGTLAAFLYSMKDITHDASLVFSAGTVVVFVVAAAAGWGFWRVIRVLNQNKPK
jgi:hypothetical protein